MSSVAQNTPSDQQQSLNQFSPSTPLTTGLDKGSDAQTVVRNVHIKQEDDSDNKLSDPIQVKVEDPDSFEEKKNIVDNTMKDPVIKDSEIATLTKSTTDSTNDNIVNTNQEDALSHINILTTMNSSLHMLKCPSMDSLRMDIPHDQLITTSNDLDNNDSNNNNNNNNNSTTTATTTTTTTNKVPDSLTTDFKNTTSNASFDGISSHFEMDEFHKLSNAKRQSQTDFSQLLSEFPNNVLDDKSKNIKIEEETETIHLQQSPNDSMIKGKNYEILDPTTKNSSSSTKNIQPLSNDKPRTEPLVPPIPQQEIQAYAMLDFESFTFYVQTMQILLGRMVEGDSLTDALDIHLGNQKAISRRHAKIFYNFGNQRFELSVLGRNGAFVDGNFVEKGVTVPLSNGTKIQIGETEFAFILPIKEKNMIDNIKDKSHDIRKEISLKRKDSIKANMDHIDNLVANFDDIQNDIQNASDKLLLSKDPKVLDIVFDRENEKLRELEIEKEIGKVLARENSKQATDFEDINNKEGLKSKKKLSKLANKINVSGNNEIIETDKSKITKPKRVPKAKKKVYTLEEIPEQYRSKPNLPYSILITDVLRKKGTERGMSLSEIYKGIQELYPFYFYCPDGWQSSVRHNLSLNKSFRKISKEGKGWLWGVNEEVIAEKDRQRQKQLENAKAKGKTLSKVIPKPLQNTGDNLSKPIINMSNNLPIQISNYNVNPSSQKQPSKPMINNEPVMINKKPAVKTEATNSSTNNMSANTKKALTYLQKELISLTKSRKMYDRATSTEILTKALAMTISQVDQAAKNFAIKGFPLVTLIDKNPGHVTKILTAALNAATLQVCKHKGLTPHLPPKNAPTTTSATTATASSKSTTSPTPSNQIPILPKLNSKPMSNIPAHQQRPAQQQPPQQPLVPPQHQQQQQSGPMVYQFSKPTIPSTAGVNTTLSSSSSASASSSNVSIKPRFKAAAPAKPSFKPTSKPNLPQSVNNPASTPISISSKPVKLNNTSINNGVGLMKPQFYAKGKSPSVNLIDDDKIRESIAKFGKPTGPDIEPKPQFQQQQQQVQQQPTPQPQPVSQPPSISVSSSSVPSIAKPTPPIKEKNDEVPNDTEESEENEDDDELNMMLANLEKDDDDEGEGEDEKDVKKEDDNESKKRSIDQVETDIGQIGSDDKKVKIE